ncbi:hypothetical protein HZH66_008981 [Vespula vulgaris]|uniref:Uncharacterized protein n=1 Tax=Vespula vulgaris TaxID=7454 RepID=A0A834JQL3_VESVU|nr:hypothetical protein HZH66_008981 [Vespula vulgaris]
MNNRHVDRKLGLRILGKRKRIKRIFSQPLTPSIFETLKSRNERGTAKRTKARLVPTEVNAFADVCVASVLHRILPLLRT